MDLVTLAKKYKLNLIQVGKVFQACCPFHDDSTPSFTIYPSDNTFYCFGCKVYGGPKKFLELIDPDAAKSIDFTIEEINSKLFKYRIDNRNMKQTLQLVSASIIYKAIRERGFDAIKEILKSFDEYLDNIEYVSFEEYHRVLNLLQNFLHVS